ncbi:MAG: SusC/RagA family TonB-linked outer membrane protein, partial [Spirosomataceae bacterium]
YNSFTTNAGEIQNSGIELLVNATAVETPNFNWNITANFSNNRNKVVSIKEGIESIFLGSDFGYAGSSASQVLYTGYAYGNILGTSYQRYYENPADEDPLILDDSRPIVIGENGFPVRNTSQKILGNSIPKYMLNIGNQFTYKNISLGFNFDFRQGFQKFNSLDNFHAAFGIADYTENRDQTIVFEGVTADGQPNTKEVFLGQGTGPDGVNYGAGFYRNVYRGVTENFVEDASWVR